MAVPRRARSRRSTQEWILRLTLVGIALLAGYVAVTFSVARLIYRSDPAKGYMLAPYDGRITAALAAKLVTDDASQLERLEADDLARLALRRDPTAVFALSTLGINSEVRGDILRARKYFAGAERLSRRNLPTQLWRIEDAVRRNDIPGALREYDITLRVMPNLWEILFPVLASANTDADIQSSLAQILKANPSWGSFFLEYLAGNSPDPRATTRLLTKLQRFGQSVASKTQASAVDKLIERGMFNEAWTYYTILHPNADSRRSRDPGFSAGASATTQFDWQPIETDGVVAMLQEGVFDFSVPTSSGGPILRQLQMLPPGSYRMEGRISDIDPASDGQSYWFLSCQNGQEISRIPLIKPQSVGGVFGGTFAVDADCPVQTLAFVARPSEATNRFVGQINRARIIPVL